MKKILLILFLFNFDQIFCATHSSTTPSEISTRIPARKIKSCPEYAQYLIDAVKNNDKDLVEKLLQSIDVNSKNQFGQTAIFVAYECDNQEIIKLLLDHGADCGYRTKLINHKNTVIESTNAILPKELAGMIHDYGCIDKEEWQKNHKKLFECFIADDIETIKKLLSSGNVNLNAQDQNGKTALIYGSQISVYEIVKFLIDVGADLNLKDCHGRTALMYASSYMPDYIAELLIKAGADINAQDNKGDTALMADCYHFKNEKCKLLLNNPFIDLNKRNHKGQTALIMATLCGNKEAVQLLLDKGANKNIQDNHGRTALNIAEAKGYQKIADLLKQTPAQRARLKLMQF